jgi:filamentous hemagglutinin family protein
MVINNSDLKIPIKWVLKFIQFIPILYFTGLVTPETASTQIIPDATLPTISDVRQIGETYEIIKGTTVGKNIFHSFSEFNVNFGETAYFDNALTIDNIITRVTGEQQSNIDGLLRANGTANLFLLNPNGIVFGPNAQLNIGGSFLASTGNSIVFENGMTFSANDPDAPPLLTMNVPIGLQYGGNAADVEVRQSRLEVSANQSLTLLGGNVTIDGGTLKAPGGQVVFGGLAGAGRVGLEGVTPSFPDAIKRGNVTLRNGAIADVTGNGSIALYTHNLDISGGSQLLAGVDQSSRQAGDILINATGNLFLSDRSLIANTVQSGANLDGGTIDISADSVAVTSGSRITTVTQSAKNAGTILLDTNNLEISGFTSDGLFSGILSHSATPNSGQGGDIRINPDNPQGTTRLTNRGFIATVTDSQNPGGTISVNVNNLIAESGGQILTLANSSGNAGDLTINATERVQISGSSTDFIRSPFAGVPVFDLDALQFSTESNPDVEASGADGIPYVSIQRTPEQILSGQTILGTAADQFDYYSFTITEANSQGIFDIDNGDGYSDNPGSLDTEIVLFNRATGEIVAANDDANITEGVGGSSVSQDSYLSTQFSSPGTYILGVGEFDSVPSSLHRLEGDRVDRGDTYRLQVSLENQGTGISLPPDTFNPDNFNPNYGTKSGLVSITQGSGNTGTLTINTGQLSLESGSEIAAATSGAGDVKDIRIQGTTLDINNSTISSITRGSGDAGSILIDAETVNLANRGLFNLSNFGQGNTGDIRIDAVNLNLVEGSRIDNGTYGRGNTGEVVINVRDTVALDGELDGDESHIYNIVAGPSAVGNAGGIEINTRVLSLTNGAGLNTNTYGLGNAGNITVNASERVLLDGKASNERGSYLLNRVRGSGRGNAGDINIVTDYFSMTNGAEALNSTEGEGNAGRFNITADEIVVSNSHIGSSVGSPDQPGAVGNGGRLDFTARQISLSNNALLSTSTFGQGNAGQIFLGATESISLDNSQIATAANSQTAGIGGGSIQIQADSLTLDNQSSLSAETTFGEGGDIDVQLNNLLLMRRHSQITATAGTGGAGGDGGNIAINAPLIVAIPTENSDITANAFKGNGGNIQLAATGIFGLKFREEQTPLSDITASSEFGVAGVVNINGFEIDPKSVTITLSADLTPQSDQVVAGCAGVEGNSFTITGGGGLPKDPTAMLQAQTVWQDLQDFSPATEGGNTSSENPQARLSNQSPRLVEATGWVRDKKGNIVLVAAGENGTSLTDPSRLPYCHELPSFNGRQN